MTNFLLSLSPGIAYLGIAVCVMLTGAGLPIPEEVFIVAAAIGSARGGLSPAPAVAACLVGALAGDCIMYWIGYHFGRNVLREQHWWSRFLHSEREAQVERLIRKHGLKVFFLARFLVGIRSPVYLSAGILRVRFRRFFLIDLFCATAVIGTFFGLSYFLSERYGGAIYRWIRDAEYLATAIVVLVVAFVIFRLWRRHRRKHSKAASGSPKNGSDGCKRAGEAVDEVERVA